MRNKNKTKTGNMEMGGKLINAKTLKGKKQEEKQ